MFASGDAQSISLSCSAVSKRRRRCGAAHEPSYHDVMHTEAKQRGTIRLLGADERIRGVDGASAIVKSGW